MMTVEASAISRRKRGYGAEVEAARQRNARGDMFVIVVSAVHARVRIKAGACRAAERCSCAE